jgi:pimeloyl-ACP methyl ester carboxylesterase
MPYIHARDNTQLFYIDAGRGRCVVFVASAWFDSRMWEFQIPYLVRHGCRCVAYDRRGHGRSDISWDGYDYDTLADDLATLLNHLDLQDVTLVAHSAGAGEAVRYLARHGAARVSRLAIVSGTTPFPMRTADNPHGIERALMEADMTARTLDRPKWVADHADGFLGTGLPGIQVSREFTEYLIRQLLDCSARAAAEFFLTGFTTDLRESVRAITVPTLIVHGDHDEQAPIDICGRKTAQLIPHATFLVYENAAHGLFVTHAGRLNADVLNFVRAYRTDPAVA